MEQNYQISRVPEWNAILNLLLDPKVSEIATNGPNQFFMKRAGQRIKVQNLPQMSEESYFKGIELGLVPFVKSQNIFDKNSFIFEGRLEYEVGETEVRGRCHIVLPPASDYPQVTIAKKTTSLLSLEAIANAGSMSDEMRRFLKMAIKAQVTICFSGQTGSGKTTMLEAVAKHIDDSYRIGVAEDTPELALPQSNVTYLHSTPWSPGMDPNNVATLDWVVAQFMRNRCDKLIIGETRGKEFGGFLKASNSGMDGCMTTIHAETPPACLRKMTGFAMESRPGVSARSINMDIASAVKLIIQLIILPGGKHRISHIEEITTTLSNNEDAQISTQPLYLYDRSSDSFYKAGNMSDSLREYCTIRGADVNEFLKSEVNKKTPSVGRIKTDEDELNVREIGISTPSPADNRRRIPTNPFSNSSNRERRQI